MRSSHCQPLRAMLIKNCPGKFSEEVQQLLTQNIDRAQWRAHPCEVCGQEVDGEQRFGKWSPKPHWPTASYSARKAKKSAKSQEPAPLSYPMDGEASFEAGHRAPTDPHSPLQKG